MFLGKIGAVPKQEKKEKSKKRSSPASKNRGNVLWKCFSLFIRLRDCGDNSHGYAKCISCGDVYHFREMDAGHFMPIGKKPTKYDERNVNAQCIPCNRGGGGNLEEYSKALGKELCEELENKSREPFKKMISSEVEKKILKYRKKIKIEARRVDVSL
jgi:hypothetical protein